ncbi:MAG: chorismate-binding protein, partial [Fuerstia sp.]|nr:chorismate-binding protein [Fuerstiella sp.]
MKLPTTHPTSAEFQALSKQARFVPVYRQLTADTLTPVTAYQRIASGPWAFLFESVIGGEKIGRFSFVGSHPFLTLTATGHNVVIDHIGKERREFECADPLKELDELVARHQSVTIPGLPGFCGGAVGYAGYDVIRYTENLPHVPPDDRHLPDLCFALYDAMVVFDHIRKVILVVALADTQDGDLEESRARAEERLEVLCRQLAFSGGDVELTDIDLTIEPAPEVKSNFTQSQFHDAVEKCREFVKAGDVFQVVISQRLEYQSPAQPLDVYRALRMVNPSPFMFLLKTPDVDLVGSSPEIMVRVEDGETTIRPLAGTRNRGKTP